VAIAAAAGEAEGVTCGSKNCYILFIRISYTHYKLSRNVQKRAKAHWTPDIRMTKR
jgi:hypothetical protein